MSLLSTFARQIRVAICALIALTVILGIAYPVAIWGISRIDAHTAEGSLVTDRNGCVVGSELLGRDVTASGSKDPYLHARVMGSPDNPMAPGDSAASAALQQGPSSEALAAAIRSRRSTIAAREHVSPEHVPVDAVTGSGSGVDPDISPAYAAIQVPRIAAATGMTATDVRGVISHHTQQRQWGLLGEPRVNVLGVNTELGSSAPRCR